jgi:hypothetical protein
MSRSEKRLSTDGANSVYLGIKYTANSWTADVNTHDYKVAVDFYLDWGHIEVVTNGNAMDDVSMSIVDVDGVYYPAGTVLKKYIYNIPMGPDYQRSFPKEAPQKKATVNLKDLYVRIEYKREDANNKDILIELSGEDGVQ